ncbi:MAG: iron-sulfur cluster assembly scaffold protein [Candidatus Lokiarchaeota archaeon]|nr:iron-sulfur cluster assembly scaffold protein [Candidatus Lokiarchaeota archaeon]
MSDDFDKFIDDLQNEVNEDVQRQYSPNALDLMSRRPNHGVMKGATCKGKFRAEDSETMSFYLKVENGIIERATYVTGGCQPAHAAGSQVTFLVRGRTIEQAEGITADDIWRAIGRMPEDSRHSVLLAEMALKDAIENFKHHE